jgi:chromosome segregation ATPase
VQSFPELSEGLAQGIEVENQLLATRHAMLEKQVSSANLSGDLATRWQAMASELEAIKAAHERAPQSRVELAEREELIFQEYDRLRAQLDAVAYQIDSQNAQLAAVNTYLEREYGRDLSQDEKDRVDALRAEIRGTLKELEDLRAQIQAEIAESRSMVGVGDDVVRAEGNVRKRYQDALARAESMLGSQGLDSSMQTARAEFPQQHQRLDAYFAKLESLVDEKVSEIRSEIEGEERLLAEHRASLQELMFASQGGAGVLAYLNFMRTRAKFDELVLRADVGLIDVKWQKKERISNQINQLFEDRTSELRMLQEAFNEVR